jgi:hypothetical protein
MPSRLSSTSPRSVSVILISISCRFAAGIVDSWGCQM